MALPRRMFKPRPALAADNMLAEEASNVLTFCMPNDEKGQTGKRGPYLKRGWQVFFLSELEKTHCVKAALDKAQVSRRTYQRYKTAHPEFVEACRDATESAVDYVEAKIYHRCLHGDKMKRFDREGKAYEEVVYPDTLIIRFMQAHRPETWHRAPPGREVTSLAASAPLRVIMLPPLEDAPQ